jgi:hypothetical protein
MQCFLSLCLIFLWQGKLAVKATLNILAKGATLGGDGVTTGLLVLAREYWSTYLLVYNIIMKQ